MKENTELLNLFTDPFSTKPKELAFQFDFATKNQDANKLEQLIKEAEDVLTTEDNASQASLLYSIGTAYGDFAKLTGLSEKDYYPKVLYCFRKSISLIEADEYNNEKYQPYIVGFKEMLYTNYANALDHCGRNIAAIEVYKKALSIHGDLEWLSAI